MSEMIERVAKAIYEEDDPWHTAFPWPNLSEKQAGAEAYRRCARAAIEAMRDIPQDMVDAGNSALSSNGVDNVEDDDAALCWQAMIDFALSQDTHSLPSEDR